MTAPEKTRGGDFKTSVPTDAVKTSNKPIEKTQTVFNARDTLAGNHDDTTVRQAVGGQ